MNGREVAEINLLRKQIKEEKQRHTDIILPMSNRLYKLRQCCDHKNPDGLSAFLEVEFDGIPHCIICANDWIIDKIKKVKS